MIARGTLRKAGALATMLVVVAACGGGSRSTPQTASAGGQCGARVFASATCESSVNHMCCSQKVDCAHDAECARLSECIFGCKGKGEGCTSACATAVPPSPQQQQGWSRWSAVLGCASHADIKNCGDDS